MAVQFQGNWIVGDVTMVVNQDKLDYAERMNRMMDTYSRVLFCSLDNVRSEQMHAIRKALRGKGEVLVGKKTMQKKIISNRVESDNASKMDKFLHATLCEQNKLVGNLALVFTNEDVASVQAILSSFRVQAPARVGAVAPCDVTVPAGNTGLEPTATSFFQALNVQTKIVKGTVEITADKKVLAVGDKVDSSVAALLQKLNISPFYYSAEVVFYIQDSLLFTAEDLSLTSKTIEDSFASALANLTAVSLATGILTEASFPHAITDGFKNLLAATLETDYSFEEYNGAKLRDDIKSGKVSAAAAPAAAAAAPAAAAAKPAAVEEDEEEDFGFGGMF